MHSQQCMQYPITKAVQAVRNSTGLRSLVLSRITDTTLISGVDSADLMCLKKLYNYDRELAIYMTRGTETLTLSLL